ncbi:heme biosynthesis protein [Clostridium beijerinckii]|uniref:Heme biosynthesis protein n=1 Tax=Clostridium beijerinckii TaxID=1520 RepID=A0A0B5QJW9_CLOBE|nr:radical SAM protein [Clostridium beijerinckii]AJG97003.1 heme biosynthesis protein [Clostridium beijerinckii]
MNVSLFFTNKCNMKCRYCYEANKMERSISYDLLDQTIEFIVNHKQKNGIDKLSVVTHGGEPLIEFDKIKYFIRNLNKRINNVEYIMTTNATLLNDEIIEYLSQHYSMLSVSIDGTKQAHNLNRIFQNGNGSYDHVIENAKRLLKKRSDLKARLTVNPQNAPFLFAGVKELMDLGFMDIAPVPDEFDTTWDEDSLKILFSQGKKIIDYIKQNELLVNVGLINDSLVKCKNSICDGGITTMSIETNGDIYPCVTSVGHEEFVIGNVYKGINKQRVDDISAWGKIKNKECVGCKRYDYCTSTRCKIINKLLTNDLHTPSVVTCNFQNVRVNLSEHYKLKMS